MKSEIIKKLGIEDDASITTLKFIELIDKMQTQTHEREMKQMEYYNQQAAAAHEREMKLIETLAQQTALIDKLVGMRKQGE